MGKYFDIRKKEKDILKYWTKNGAATLWIMGNQEVFEPTKYG